MINLLIFGFGLVVVVIVGSALAILIKANNRLVDQAPAVPVLAEHSADQVLGSRNRDS